MGRQDLPCPSFKWVNLFLIKWMEEGGIKGEKTLSEYIFGFIFKIKFAMFYTLNHLEV